MKSFARTLTAIACTFTVGLAAAQGSYPDKPITVIVPFPPGVVDGYARLIVNKASAILGQPMVIKNQAGAGQRIGTDALAKSKPDGYTIGVITNAGVVSGPVLSKITPYDPLKDLSYLSMALESHYLVVTQPQSGIKTVAQLQEKAKAAPGKLTFGSTGLGTGFHLAIESFVTAAGVSMLHVPYKGESPMITDLIGGHVTIGISSLANRTMVETGKLVALAYTGEKRATLMPNVPTAKEQGVPYTSSGWIGFAAPAGLPADVRAKLIAAFVAAGKDPEVIESFTKTGLEPRDLAGDAFAARVANELAQTRELNKTLKISLD
ncbi:MAG: tripartite tricarboxylate transporter substrate binding protein [Rhodoferax sp.]|nr:tripartite tricarboxylate transporter substrate binding protein [Rhodoferax sp.]